MIEALCVCLRAMQSIILYANETYDRGWLRLASPHLLPSFEPGRRVGMVQSRPKLGKSLGLASGGR